MAGSGIRSAASGSVNNFYNCYHKSSPLGRNNLKSYGNKVFTDEYEFLSFMLRTGSYSTTPIINISAIKPNSDYS
jgi:hypothetical protein